MFECSSGIGIRQYNLDRLVGCLYVSTHGCLAVVGKSYEHQPPQLPNLEYGGTCVFLSAPEFPPTPCLNPQFSRVPHPSPSGEKL